MPGVYVFGVRRATSRELLEQDRTEEQQCEEHQQHLAEKKSGGHGLTVRSLTLRVRGDRAAPSSITGKLPWSTKTRTMRLLRHQGLEQRSLNAALEAATSDT